MTRVAKENQGVETTFVDLENADEEQVNHALRDNTKVCTYAFNAIWSLTSRPLADMDRVSHKSDTSFDRYTPDRCYRKSTSFTTSSIGGQYLHVAILLVTPAPRSRYRPSQSHKIRQRSL